MFLWSWKKLWILSFIVLGLTACPSLEGSFTLNVTEATQGESVTATLDGLDGNDARVTVAGLAADVTEVTNNSVTFTIPSGVPEGEQEVVIVAGDRIARGKITIVVVAGTLVLDRKNAARAEVVEATTTEVDLSRATLNIVGQEVAIKITGENSFTFAVPDDAPAGPQTVTLETLGGNLNQSLEIWGDIVPDKLTLLLKPDVTQDELLQSLERLNFGLEQYRELGASEGPCASAFADIDANGTPLGEALEELEGEDIVLYIDPRTRISSGAIDHLGAVGASVARTNGFTGTGTTIAVLDTGVNPHPELTDRPFISPFNAIDGSTDVTDAYNLDSDGHGTPIAVLAAGSASGVAPGASVMPVKTCNELGECFSSDVIVGVCHALTAAPDLSKLILNLSLGGDTPVDALEAILDFALQNGVQVAAAAGNEGELGSPTHYPAAFNLPGLVAVGALEASNLQCVDFQSKAINTRYDPSDPQAVPPVPPTTFEDSGRTITVEGFQRSTTSPQEIEGSFAIVEDEGQGGGVAPDVQLATARLAFTFEDGLDGVTLRYGDFNQGEGGFNLAVNGDLNVFFGSLSDVNGTTLGGVTISAIQDLGVRGEPLPTGTLRLTGSVSSLTIGGTSLWLDDICPLQADAWQPAAFSTRGDYVDISAPGVALRSGTPGGAYADYEGTSFSTPLVAGAMALWLEADSSLSPISMEETLRDDALPLTFTPEEVGAGLLNLNVPPFNVPPVTVRASSQ